MKEIYEAEKGLVSYEKWVKTIGELKEKTKELGQIKTEEEAEEIIKKILTDAVIKRSKKKNALLFSGGVDSSTIAIIMKNKGIHFTCYSVGLKGSPDIEYAKRIARDYNLKVRIKELKEEEIRNAIEKVKKIIMTDNKVEIAIATVSYFALNMIKEKNVFTGLGSEDIFAGYQRYLNALKEKKDINEECWNGLKTTYERDLIRESRLAKFFGIKARTPFMDKEVIINAMRISPELKIKDGLKKWILRRTSEDLGLKKEYAERPKKAAQYGSRINKVVMKLLKDNKKK